MGKTRLVSQVTIAPHVPGSEWVIIIIIVLGVLFALLALLSLFLDVFLLLFLRTKTKIVSFLYGQFLFFQIILFT